MPKKVLFCATVDIHFKAFHLPYLKWFKEQGWEVHVASSGDLELPYTDKKYNLPIQRSPLKMENIRAYSELKAIINKNEYEIIHCHTPMGGVLARLAARQARKQGTKVIYTAHGFHFCKGVPFINWALYYPVEKLLAHYTDCLITINEEDYNLALRHGFKAKRVEQVHGVGIDNKRFGPVTAEYKMELKQKKNYRTEDFLMFYAAEFNKNKNQQFLIRALAHIKEEVPYARLLLAGKGPLFDECYELANKLGVADKVDFLGYRTDIDEILPMCDIAVASSLREGLPVNIMEAMSCGLPVIATDNRGHRELIHNDENGWIISPNDFAGMSDRIKTLASNEDLRIKLGSTGRHSIESRYAINQVLMEKISIYASFTDELEVVKWAVQ
ncbi:glycosyltransferase [Paenibacillus sp. LMG 31456]|uniref:Glycosyltransferase n=1 Tax=Paenibacillus foliorum TaxID=2654974 RepID=A0A972K5R3_9BACL|nr:glycosyltransferase family 4 protein [Paenibacillus foliorum]NOU97327.1 glycosyltransferase [Paenibacillus foliorum]